MPEGEAVAHVALAPCLLSGSGSPIGGHKEALSRIHEAEAVYSHCFGSSRLLKPRLPAARSGAGTLVGSPAVAIGGGRVGTPHPRRGAGSVALCRRGSAQQTETAARRASPPQDSAHAEVGVARICPLCADSRSQRTARGEGIGHLHARRRASEANFAPFLHTMCALCAFCESPLASTAHTSSSSCCPPLRHFETF
jgi:hypothetical protein